MNSVDTDELQKLLDAYLSESLQAESPNKRALLRGLGPMAIQSLYLAWMQGGSAGIAASRLLFEVMGLVSKGQKPATLPEDAST